MRALEVGTSADVVALESRWDAWGRASPGTESEPLYKIAYDAMELVARLAAELAGARAVVEAARELNAMTHGMKKASEVAYAEAQDDLMAAVAAWEAGAK